MRGEQLEDPDDEAVAFRLRERLEESFRLPDDADRDLITAFYTHGTLELHVPRTALEPRPVPIEHRSPYVSNPGAEPC